MSEIKSGNSYRFLSYSDGKYLNILTSTTPANNKNVTTYSLNSSDMCQVWKCVSHSNGSVSGMLMKSERDNTFSLDRYRGSSNYNNADVYATATTTADLKDQLVTFVSATQGYYRIKLAYADLYLTVTSTNTTGGHDVRWKALTGDTDQLWLPQLYYDASPIPSAPNNILNKTFAIQAKDTGFNLNIHGVETVANERNVNIYSTDDVQAQRWIVKQTSAGPKLFTKLNEDFALNIRTTDNERTMYTAQGNDKDSVLEFISAGESMCYKIRAYNHDKYLSISGDVKSGADVIWSSSDKATVWKFVDENTAFPPFDPIPSEILNKEFYLMADNSECYLNVHGTESVAVGRNVNVYTKEKCNAQTWIAKYCNGKPRLFTKLNNAFALNIFGKTNSNCTMYTANGNERDSVLDFKKVDTLKYKIKMHYHDKYLTVDGEATKGTNVIWTDDYDKATVWTFKEEDDVFIPAPGAPAELIGNEFFLRAGNSQYYLNVHGSDTVVNTRNVNVFSLENCQSQKWVVKGSSRNPKLYTAIDTTFALNIYNDNCTMYKADGNDLDSILEFMPITSMNYRIKMFHHNKYLAVSSTPSTGANVIWTSDIAKATVWRFMKESDLDFPTSGISDNFTPDSSLVTSVIPAHTNNFTVDRSANGAHISEICIHHAAGNISVKTLGALWQNPNRAGSSHYGVSGTNIGQYVKESNIAWTNGHWPSNKRSVTIETSNSSGAPDWLVSDTTLDTLIRLVADIARRNNLGKLVVGKNLTYHSMYANTLCPGPYLLSKLSEIAIKANRINNNITPRATNLTDGTYYINDYGTNKYINIDSVSNSIPTLNMDIAGDKSGQRWKIVTDNTGTKLISEYKNMILSQNSDGVNCIIDSSSTNTKNLNVDIVPYISDNIPKEKFAHYIKLKNENKYLSSDGKNVKIVSGIANAHLWQIKTSENTIPEIIDNIKTAFKAAILSIYNITIPIKPDSISTEWPFEVSTDLFSIGGLKIYTTYTLLNSFQPIDGYLQGISMDFNSDGNCSYTVSSDTWGVGNIVGNIDVSKIDEAYSAAMSIGTKFPGGKLYFKLNALSNNTASLDMLYNVDLLPDNDKVSADASFKVSYIIEIDTPELPKFEFSMSPELAINLSAVMVFIVLIFGAYYDVISIPLGILEIISTIFSENGFLSPLLS